jgi:cytochrome c-type biogenesis protein CcmE
MKPKHKRLIIVLAGLTSIFVGVFILLNTFRDNLIYFYPPAEIVKIQSAEPQRFAGILKKQIRVGGMVKQGSYSKSSELDHTFSVTDYGSDLEIRYHGLLPPMFREGQGVVAQGNLVEESSSVYFAAKTLITKHDEKYMPPEIERSLKKK